MVRVQKMAGKNRPDPDNVAINNLPGIEHVASVEKIAENSRPGADHVVSTNSNVLNNHCGDTDQVAKGLTGPGPIQPMGDNCSVMTHCLRGWLNLR